MTVLRPSKGPVHGGSIVTIEVGGGLSVAEESVTCVFGGKRVSGYVQKGKQVECIAPGAKDAGIVKVEIDNVDGGLSGSLDFEYYLAPVISRLTPSRGALSGGAMVTLHGTGFLNEGLRCKFGPGSAGEGQGRYISSSLVSCMAPGAVEEGPVTVEVSMNAGVDYSGAGKEYMYEICLLYTSDAADE